MPFLSSLLQGAPECSANRRNTHTTHHRQAALPGLQAAASLPSGLRASHPVQNTRASSLTFTALPPRARLSSLQLQPELPASDTPASGSPSMHLLRSPRPHEGKTSCNQHNVRGLPRSVGVSSCSHDLLLSLHSMSQRNVW